MAARLMRYVLRDSGYFGPGGEFRHEFPGCGAHIHFHAHTNQILATLEAIQASADLDEYAPGMPVTVTLNGGSYGGWIRALLYDDLNQELVRASGPTGTGDDGQGHPVSFPVELNTTAPVVPGDYVWEAAWFGANNSGTEHFERRTPVTIRVTITTSVSEGVRPSTWGRIKATFD